MNQKRTNGFTLIELLAVIVILAIIALIAVPVILNIIDKANKSAFKDTAYGVISAGELYFAEQQLDLNGMTSDVTIELPDSRLELKGDVPEGKVTIAKDGKIAIAVQNGRYCVTKRLDDKDVTITEGVDNCELPDENESSTPSENPFPITWNTLDVVNNTSFDYMGRPIVKVSSALPSLEDMKKVFVFCSNSNFALPFEQFEYLEVNQKAAIAGYNYYYEDNGVTNNEAFGVFIVYEAGSYEGFEVSEPGIYALNYGNVENYSFDFDVVIDYAD